jgi:hypothetical protein
MRSIEHAGELIKTEYGWAVKSFLNKREIIHPLNEADEYFFRAYPNEAWEGRRGLFVIMSSGDKIDTMRLVEWETKASINPIEELEKCLKSPYYFATTYAKVSGKPFITDLSEDDFNRFFNVDLTQFNTRGESFEFEDCELSPFYDKIMYSIIENLVISWTNDGKKTAGTLTRRIMKYIHDARV